MKKVTLFVFLSYSTFLFSQEKELKPFSLEADYFYGTILEHNTKIGHLITHHPEGFVLKYNRKTYGFNQWEKRYNYPDWGFSFSYQNMKNPALGSLYGAYGHISWYFLNRNLRLTVGQGIAYADNPYHPDNNYNNNAYGSHLVSATYLQAVFIKENLWKGLGFQAGLYLLHYSNGNLKAPNTSTNTFSFGLGLNYQPDYESFPDYIPKDEKERYSEPIKYNLEFRFGLNESDVIGMGQYPFYIFSVSADKKISRKSTFLAGTEIFFSTFLKEYIYYRSVAYPEDGLKGDEDYKRVGIFAGYELKFNKIAAFAHLGYYVYYPYDFEGHTYNRIGLKRYFGKRERFFALVDVKAHGAKAEAIEFGVGVRL